MAKLSSEEVTGEGPGAGAAGAGGGPMVFVEHGLAWRQKAEFVNDGQWPKLKLELKNGKTVMVDLATGKVQR